MEPLLRRLPPAITVLAALHVSALARADEPESPEAAPPAPSAFAAVPPAVPDEAARRKQAEQHFDHGLELVQAERWDAALAEFRASAELYPTRVALKNAAVCLGQLSRFTEAMDTWNEVLRRFGSSMTPEQRSLVDDALASLRRNTGELVILGDPPGATVAVDGREVGTTPLRAPIAVNAGSRTVRVHRDGFTTFQAIVDVAGQQRKTIHAQLRALARSGRLAVTESSGEAFEVVVDGVVVGRTPWVGALAVGRHVLLLRGNSNRGTPPMAFQVDEGKATNLSLRAELLDTALRVEPTPSNATVFVDGIEVGSGIWDGRLKSGIHRIEIAREGFFAQRRDLRLDAGAGRELRVALDRDLTNPIWREAFRPFFVAELVLGGAVSPGLGGSADAACGRGECTDRTRPWGGIAGARGGYQFTSFFAAEAFLGYVTLTEQMTRIVRAEADVPVISEDYQDRTRLSGTALAASASFRVLERTPLVARIWAGALHANASFDNAGTWKGSLPAANGQPQDFAVARSIAESHATIWIPFVAPEVKIGYRFTRSIVVDAGLAAWLLFPPEVTRQGLSARDRERAERSGVLPEASTASGSLQPGTLRLPRETGLNTCVVLIPNISARFEF